MATSDVMVKVGQRWLSADGQVIEFDGTGTWTGHFTYHVNGCVYQAKPGPGWTLIRDVESGPKVGQAFAALGAAVDSPAGRRLLSRQNVQAVIDAHRGQPFHTAFTAGMVAACEEVEMAGGDAIGEVAATFIGVALKCYERDRGGLTKPRHEPDSVATKAYERARVCR